MVATGQAGTVVQSGSAEVVVLLANGDLWRGYTNKVWIPTSDEELEQAIRDVDRFEGRMKPKKKRD